MDSIFFFFTSRFVISFHFFRLEKCEDQVPELSLVSFAYSFFSVCVASVIAARRSSYCWLNGWRCGLAMCGHCGLWTTNPSAFWFTTNYYYYYLQRPSTSSSKVDEPERECKYTVWNICNPGVECIGRSGISRVRTA